MFEFESNVSSATEVDVELLSDEENTVSGPQPFQEQDGAASKDSDCKWTEGRNGKPVSPSKLTVSW